MTERVTLRFLAPQDRAEFIERARASESLHRPWVAPPKDAAGFDALLEASRAPSGRTFVVADRTDEAMVGVFNLSHIVRGPLQSAFLGYYVFAPYSGRGLMGEGLALVLREIFVDLRLHRVEANVQPQNVPSLALVRSAGFRKEGFSHRYLKVAGRWRDHERWALTAEDWRAARSVR